jgi:hypothetical protein
MTTHHSNHIVQSPYACIFYVFTCWFLFFLLWFDKVHEIIWILLLYVPKLVFWVKMCSILRMLSGVMIRKCSLHMIYSIYSQQIFQIYDEVQLWNLFSLLFYVVLRFELMNLFLVRKSSTTEATSISLKFLFDFLSIWSIYSWKQALKLLTVVLPGPFSP